MHDLLKYRIKSGIITITIFILLILILLYVRFHTPIPPYPEGGGGPGLGLEVNLGSSFEGSGELNETQGISTPSFEQSQAVDENNEKILTSDDEESEVIKSISEKTENKKVKNKNESLKPKVSTKEQTIEQKPVVNKKALFPVSKNNEGNTTTPGQQGTINGSANSPIYTGDGIGSGGGTGGGSGTGTGTDSGSGISLNLEGRSPSYLKKPLYKGQSEGKVVVEITVDKNGKVTSARPGVSGSTILDEDLLQVAKDAALQSTFNPKPDATVQKGRITYRFMLQ